MCIWVGAHTCTYVYMSTWHIHRYLHTGVHRPTYENMCTQVHTCTHVYTGWCAHMCIRVHAHMHRYIDTHRLHRYTHVNTCIHRYTHRRNHKSQRCTQTPNTPYKNAMDSKATLNGLTSRELKLKASLPNQHCKQEQGWFRSAETGEDKSLPSVYSFKCFLTSNTFMAQKWKHHLVWVVFLSLAGFWWRCQ